MIIVDTNVVSELPRPSPEPRLEGWLAAQDGLGIYLTAISEAELRYGFVDMDDGKRHDGLADVIDRILRDDMAGRVLAFDSTAAEANATIAASRRAAGRLIAHADCQVAAIARARGATVATRNTVDLESRGFDLIDPWAAA